MNNLDSYLTPTNIQPYHLLKCAEWMVTRGYFSNKSDAFRYLCFLANNNTPKLLIYYNMYNTKFQAGYIPTKNNEALAFISASGAYGEPHMNFTNS